MLFRSHIAALPKLNWLCLSGNFSDRSMISLTECPSLKLLEIHIESFSDKGMRYISQIPNLEGFKAHWMEKITNQGVSYLKSVSNLKKLDIKHAAITEQALHDLGTMTSLEYLMLPDQFTDSGVEMLSGLKKLNFLWINTSSNSTLSNRSMKVVSGFPLLEELHISGTNINDEGIRQLNQLKMLRVLNLCMINLTDQSFKSLDGLKKLERITFYPPIPLSTNGLNHLNPLTALKNINCHNTTKGTQPLNLSGLKHLESLILIMDQDYKKGPGRAYRSLLGDEDVKFLEKLETLDEFHLLGAELSNAGFKSIAGLPKLHWLKLSGPLKIADADFSVFPLDSPIINISIDFGHFTGTCLDHLTKLKYLRQLELTTDTRLDNNRINKFKNDSQIQHIKFTPRK